jgi:hypothetical protein
MKESIDILKEYVDFILRPKTIKDVDKIAELISLKVSSFSHTAFPEQASQFYKGYTGHLIRKNFRRDLMIEIREYIRSKLK